MIRKVCGIFLLLFATVTLLRAQRLKITPAQPERGDTVEISYDPSAAGATIRPAVKGITLVFTYSNLYSLPWQMPLVKQGHKWVARFKLPRYATYATFYLRSGDVIDKPAPDRHYEIKVFKNGQPVEDSYLYKAYSLSAQMGKSSGLANRQLALFQEELKHFPDNYEARIRMLDTQIKLAGEDQRDSLKKKALQVIADKFYSDPTNGDNLNKVTMGYLIIGENKRLDSIRRIIAERYAASDLGREYRVYFAIKEKDSLGQIKLFEQELPQENEQNKKSFESIHEKLFQYYADGKNEAKALYHAKEVLESDSSPYRLRTITGIIQQLMHDSIALDQAMQYAREAYTIADTFRVGLIRYFPETGYIYPYVTDSARDAEHRKAKANVLSMMGVISMKQGNRNAAADYIRKATALSLDDYTIKNARAFYESTGDQKSINELAMREEKALRKKLLAMQTHKKSPLLNMFVDLKGNPVDTASMKNKLLVINFWATWCGPCMAEMPYVQKTYDKFRGDKDVMFMIVNSGSGNKLQDAQNWPGNRQYSFPVYFNTDPEIGTKFNFNTIPATYIIDRSGYIRFTNIGFDGSDIVQKLSMQIELARE